MELTGKYPRLITLAASAIVIAALYFARGVFIPFVLAMLVSFLLAPLVLRLQRLHFSRAAAVVTAVLLVFVASSGAAWIVVGQVREVTSRLPEYRHNIHDKMATLRGVVSKPFSAATKIVTDLGSDLAPSVDPEAALPPIPTVRIAEPTRGPFEVVRDTVRVLREAGTPLPRREIAARLGVKPWIAGYRLDKAVELRFAEKLSGGRYQVTDVVPAL
jgi:hypothetical protein